ncbi:hypothetical protein A1O3_00467 [Capronia epimyces CBS 606.96]|uniref:Folliculin-interacting protein N-terminal domain-containing protein n=1 Tax=Capronia epimyces CBS 606.96 TaxID=1182542 RepID=W9YGC2_9EURO|nr:uncharacterized protein A1O3_00467 [Capronia epimyces CBS 606.96]EXJ91917.1 hypothetical protein A1O3_00467 [Capronia epimyces CBS 606.96]
MLGRLIQGYARGSQLESTTDESHTRALLWPELASDARSHSFSPPTTPFGSPSYRVAPFDDRSGLELNESRDLRLIIAQDAFGTNDRPMVLLDTQCLEPGTSSSESGSQKSSGSPYSSETGGRTIPGVPIYGHARHRSSTISGASASWARSFKESETTDHISNILDCMFGVSSATKSGSSTKMHLLPGDRSVPTDLGPRASIIATSPAATRTPLLRAKTATQATNTHRHAASPRETDMESRDAILITRMFPVSLPDSQEDLRQHRGSSAGTVDPASPVSPVREQQDSPSLQSKKPKLVEKKTPVYAAALLCYLPRSGDVRPGTSGARPSSRASTMASSIPNSYGSDSLSSWTILNTIPDHLLSPETSAQVTDQGIEIIVKKWDVILRSLAVVEEGARAEICDLLQQVNLAMISSAAKAPKGPSEQRTNQRNVYLRSPNALARNSALHRVVKHALWRVSYALRVPRVVTGFGLDPGGPWLDEARYLVRACGNKQHNFFLFNLMTAFLGNHTEWLERIGPDWYRKQFQALNQRRARPSNLACRTVIICDNRSMARRLIFLLASFLPRSYNVDPLARLGSGIISPLSTPDISSPSSAGRLASEGMMRRHAYSGSRDGSMSFSRRDVAGLSTSASSTDSTGGIGRRVKRSSQSGLSRPDFEPSSSRHPSVFSPTSDRPSQLHKTNPTSSTVTPRTGTPVPHFSTKGDSYFPEGAVADGDASSASADLARILRRESISNAQTAPSSISWGSLISNVSGLWGKKQDVSSSSNEATTKSLRDRRRVAPRMSPMPAIRPSTLERMVDEAADLQPTTPQVRDDDASVATRKQSAPSDAQPPRLRVDDKDGVVDVDINLPGFIGWDESKATSLPSSLRHHSPIFPNTDEATSSYSSRSNRFRSTGSSSAINVAGYLKRYHQDFILQGVKPYPELQDEIRQSMSQEVTPVDNLYRPFPEEEAGGELWVNVCTTLVADLRTFTIQRLTLRRRVRSFHPAAMRSNSSFDSRADDVPDENNNSHQRKSPEVAPDGPERFLVETVMDFDTTLTDAVERVLNEAEHPRQALARPHRGHSRTESVGTTSSAKSEPLEIAGSRKAKQWAHLSQSDCRQVVVGALEEVVRSVNDDLAKHQRARDVDGHVRIDGKALDHEMKQDNVLREGVKKWLLNVETRTVW